MHHRLIGHARDKLIEAPYLAATPIARRIAARFYEFAILRICHATP
jgi:hypothetical protein